MLVVTENKQGWLTKAQLRKKGKEPTGKAVAFLVTETIGIIADERPPLAVSGDGDIWQIASDGYELYDPTQTTKIKRRKLSEKERLHNKTCTFIRKLTSRWDIGEKVAAKNGIHPIHLNRKEDINSFLDGTNPDWHPQRFSNRSYDAHFNDEITYYYSGSGRPEGSLASVDIDCHETGTIRGAVDCARHILQHFLPGGYVQASERGVHIHFVVTGGPTNAALKHLEKVLQPLAEKFDVEAVEVKGMAPEWSGGRLFKSGVLIKLPRLKNDEDKKRFLDVAKFSVQQLLSFPIPKPTLAVLPETKTKPKATKKVIGSPSSVSIGSKEIKVLDKLEAVADRLMRQNGKPSGFQKKDLAISLFLLWKFMWAPNADESMPNERFKFWWCRLYDEGWVDRAWNPVRFAKLKKWLHSIGGIETIDMTFWFDRDGVDAYGKKRWNGQAAKWRMDAGLFRLVEKVIDDKTNKNNLIVIKEEGERGSLDKVTIKEFVATRPKTVFRYEFAPPDNVIVRRLLLREQEALKMVAA